MPAAATVDLPVSRDMARSLVASARGSAMLSPGNLGSAGRLAKPDEEDDDWSVSNGKLGAGTIDGWSGSRGGRRDLRLLCPV